LDEGQSSDVTAGVAGRAAGFPGAGLALAGGVVIFAGSLAILGREHVQDGSFQSGMIDLRIYRAGGLLALRSGNLYGAHILDNLYFTYPPMAALVFSTLAAIPMATLRWLLIAASIGSLTVTMWITAGMLGHRRPAARLGVALAAAGIALRLQPVWQTISFGQVNLVLMVIIMADLCLPDTAWFKGVGVGLAAGFKLTPLIFIPYLLLTRRVRAAGVSLATFMLTIATSAIALPVQSRQYWPGLLFLNSGRTGNISFVGNQSLYGTLARLLGSPSAAGPYWAAVAAVVGVAGLLIAAGWSRRGQEVAGILTCALTGLLICPVSWEHHWVWAAPALIMAADVLAGLWRPRPIALGPGSDRWPADGQDGSAFLRRWAWPATIAALVWVFLSDPPQLVPASVVQGQGAHGMQLLAGNLYVIAGLGILGLAGYALLAHHRLARHPQGNATPRAPERPQAVVIGSVRTGGGPADPRFPTE
jgi:alpha-1,2-mannosyltransferase